LKSEKETARLKRKQQKLLMVAPEDDLLETQLHSEGLTKAQAGDPQFLNTLLRIGSQVVMERQKAAGIKLPDFTHNGADLAEQLGHKLFKKGKSDKTKVTIAAEQVSPIPETTPIMSQTISEIALIDPNNILTLTPPRLDPNAKLEFYRSRLARARELEKETKQKIFDVSKIMPKKQKLITIPQTQMKRTSSN